MAQIPESAYPLFDEKNFAMVATVMADGSPQVTPVWVDRDEQDNTILFNTAYGREKPDNIARDSRVAVAVFDTDNPYHYIQVRGKAELIDEGADAHIHKLSHKYRGKDYPLQPGDRRVIVKVTPESVFHRAP